jgi:hypothetical protein
MAPGRLTEGWRTPGRAFSPEETEASGRCRNAAREPTQRQRGEDRQPRVAYAHLGKEKAVREQIAWGTRRGAG